MKKTLVVLLALVMVLAFAATALADNPGVGDEQIASYTDLADTKDEWASAIYKLTALGVLQGDGIGTKYRPDSNLTRAEFAVIATHLAGVYSQVDYYSTQASKFTDVPANYWGKGYINTVDANNLMIGRGANKFDPNGKVSMQEVATVVLRILGYNFDSTYPIGYANKAAEIGLLDYVQYNGPTYITRAEMASISAEALDCYKVKYVGKDTLTSAIGLVDDDGYSYVTWKTNEKNAIADALDSKVLVDYFFGRYVGVPMLYSVFGCVDIEVIFNGLHQVLADTAGTSALLESLGWGYSDFDNGQIVAKVNEVSGYYGNGERGNVVNIPFADEYYIYGGELVDLAGQIADLTVDVENNRKTYGEVKFVNLKSDVFFGEDTKKADESKIEFFTIAAADVDYDDFLKYKTSENGVKYYGDGKIDYTKYESRNYGVVKSVSSKTVSFVTDETAADYTPITNINLKDNDVVFWNMDTKAFMTPDKLVKGDVVYDAGTVQTLGEKVELYLVYSATKGTLGRYNDGYAVISDVTYDSMIASLCSIDNMTTFLDWQNADDFNLEKEVTFAGAYVPGSFTYVANDTVSYFYGVINEFIYEGKYSGYRDNSAATKTLKAIEVIMPTADEDGKYIKTYDVASDCDIENGIDAGALVAFTLNKSGKISEIDLGKNTAGSDAGKLTGIFGELFETDEDATVYVDADEKTIQIDKDEEYDVTDSTVIYILRSTGEEDTYKIDSGYVVKDTADFLSTYDGSFTAEKAAIAKASGTKAQVVYLIDVDYYNYSFEGFVYDEDISNMGNGRTVTIVSTKDGKERSFTFANKAVAQAADAEMKAAGSGIFCYKLENDKVADYAVIDEADFEGILNNTATSYNWAELGNGYPLMWGYDESIGDGEALKHEIYDGEFYLVLNAAQYVDADSAAKAVSDYIIGYGEVTDVTDGQIKVAVKGYRDTITTTVTLNTTNFAAEDLEDVEEKDSIVYIRDGNRLITYAEYDFENPAPDKPGDDSMI